MTYQLPCVEKIFINLNAPVTFNLRQKILGDQNANLQYIVNETKANVSLRGRGSGFIESNLGMESSEPLHLYIEHPVLKNLIEAKNLARNLLETIQSDLQIFIQTNPSTQTNIPIQQPPPIIQTSNQQITIPSVLTHPPPNLIQSNSIQPTHIIQQPFIPQSQIIPQSMQIIQNIPPPTGIQTIRTAAAAATTATLPVQFQGQPTNIQIQPTAQQILVNQAPTQQYQLQYIQNPIASAPQAQTIQHFIQPQQQIQGIIQPNGQQFITVQGNTAFMLPPPNIIQQSPQTATTAIFNTAPPIAISNSVEDVVKTTANDFKVKQEEQQQKGAITTSRININQPPPPPIQQFIVNANAWPQQQHQQQTQMPINSQQQIQFVAQQPQAIRNGNEIVIPVSQGQHHQQQQVITYNPQHQIQQIQFSNQPIITQPPPSTQISIQSIQNVQQEHQQRLANQAMSYQQQFEQKINMMSESQQRALKRKIDESEADSNKSFPKTGMGSMTKNRPPPPIQQQQQQQQQHQQQMKMNNNNNRNMKANTSSSNSGGSCASTSGDNMSINNSKNNKSVYNKNNNSSTTTAMTTKINVSQVDTKLSKLKNKNEYAESYQHHHHHQQHQQDMQNQFTVRPLNQILRFNGPLQNHFIHHQQQPPPNMQFNQQPRAQIMTLPPPPIQIQHHHQQQQQQDMNSFQNNNNFIQQVNVNRFNAPQQQQQQQQQRGGIMMMGVGGNNGNTDSGNYQQPRFQRQQWQ